MVVTARRAGSSTNSPMGSSPTTASGHPEGMEREPTDAHVSIRDADAGDNTADAACRRRG